MLDLPPVIGHRGAAAVAPENTLAAIRRAAQAGLTWVEVDVRLSGDDVPIIMHDKTLDRTTNHAAFVDDLDAWRIHELDAGSWFADTFRGEPVPTLALLLEEARDLGLGVNLELKPEGRNDGKLAGEVLDIIELVHEQSPPILISSFSVTCLAVFRNLASEIPRGWLVEHLPADWRQQVDTLELYSLHIDEAHLDVSTLNRVLETKVPVLAYTVNETERAHTLLRAGVTSVISDHPDLLSDGPF